MEFTRPSLIYVIWVKFSLTHYNDLGHKIPPPQFKQTLGHAIGVKRKKTWRVNM